MVTRRAAVGVLDLAERWSPRPMACRAPQLLGPPCPHTAVSPGALAWPPGPSHGNRCTAVVRSALPTYGRQPGGTGMAAGAVTWQPLHRTLASKPASLATCLQAILERWAASRAHRDDLHLGVKAGIVGNLPTSDLGAVGRLPGPPRRSPPWRAAAAPAGSGAPIGGGAGGTGRSGGHAGKGGAAAAPAGSGAPIGGGAGGTGRSGGHAGKGGAAAPPAPPLPPAHRVSPMSHGPAGAAVATTATRPPAPPLPPAHRVSPMSHGPAGAAVATTATRPPATRFARLRRARDRHGVRCVPTRFARLRRARDRHGVRCVPTRFARLRRARDRHGVRCVPTRFARLRRCRRPFGPHWRRRTLRCPRAAGTEQCAGTADAAGHLVRTGGAEPSGAPAPPGPNSAPAPPMQLQPRVRPGRRRRTWAWGSGSRTTAGDHAGSCSRESDPEEGAELGLGEAVREPRPVTMPAAAAIRQIPPRLLSTEFRCDQTQRNRNIGAEHPQFVRFPRGCCPRNSGAIKLSETGT